MVYTLLTISAAISDFIYNKTLCMGPKQYGDQDFYNMHSLYGLSMSQMTLP